MTDMTPRPLGVPQEKHGETAAVADGAPRPAPRPTSRSHSVAGGRIAAAGVGIVAMLGLVANMEVADGRTQSPTPTKSTSLVSQRAAKGVHHGAAAAPGKIAAARVKRPIVLTPHVVVHTVTAPSSGGSGGGYAYAASAPASAPVASTSGSRP
jgi:hypothetical protein